MKTNDLLEGNKLIAEFMGVIPDNGFYDGFKLYKAGLPFHYGAMGNGTHNPPFETSWDWLMPVIGKISNQCEEPEELDGLKYALLCNDIETAFQFVVDYLRYNQK